VAYSSSSEDDTVKPEQKKRKKLPSLPSSLTPVVPIDDPALHQGRTRSTPHVEGQFATYIYVPLFLDPRSPLVALIDDVLHVAAKDVPTIHPLGVSVQDGSASSVKPKKELHISLSCPLFVRAHQREDIKRAISAVAQSYAPFNASFASFSELRNDDSTRIFLAMEIGAGHASLSSMSNALSPALGALRQSQYYTDPRFHASIAWALLDANCAEDDQGEGAEAPAWDGDSLPPSSSHANNTESERRKFSRITQFPPGLVQGMNQTFGSRLSSTTVGAFEADRICAKIGNRVHSWRLRGGLRC